MFEDCGCGSSGEFWGVACGWTGEFDEGEHGFGAGLRGEEVGAQVPELGDRIEGGLHTFVGRPVGERERGGLEFGEDVFEGDGLVEEEGEDAAEGFAVVGEGRGGVWRGCWRVHARPYRLGCGCGVGKCGVTCCLRALVVGARGRIGHRGTEARRRGREGRGKRRGGWGAENSRKRKGLERE